MSLWPLVSLLSLPELLVCTREWLDYLPIPSFLMCAVCVDTLVCRWRCTCAPNSHVEIRGHSWLWVLSFHCDTRPLVDHCVQPSCSGSLPGLSDTSHLNTDTPGSPMRTTTSLFWESTLLLILEQHDTGPSLQPVFQVLLSVCVSTPQHMCAGQRALDGISSLLLLCGFTELTSVRFFSASVYPLSHLASPLPIFSSSFSL